MSVEGQPNVAAEQPLGDLRVLAIEQYASGPFATQALASLGAEIIKIEDPSSDGDVGRGVPPDGQDGDSLFFQTFNHGKRSISLDLRTPAGREVFEGLVASSDAVFYNLRGDVPAKLRLRYEDLRHVNPRIVCVSLSAYGMTGPRAAEPGYDYLIQGVAGWMHLTGEPDGPPTKTGISLVDFASGYAAALGTVTGVHEARRTGVGRDWDLSLYDVGMSLLTYLATWQLTLGRTPTRTRHSAHPTLVPFQNLQTADGWMVVAVAKEVFWERLRDELDDPGLHDERFATFGDRLRHQAELLEVLEPLFAERETAAWVTRLQAAGVPCGPIHGVEDAFADAQAIDRDLVVRFPHERYGEVQVVRSAVLPAPIAAATTAAPALGADTREVLRSLLGVDDGRLASLLQAGAFGPVPAPGSDPS